jgi:penicillin-binding protein 1C
LHENPLPGSHPQGGKGASRRQPGRGWPQRRFFAVIGISAALIAGYFALRPPALDRAHNVSMLVLARDGSLLRGFLSTDGKWRLPVSSDAVDPLYRRILIAAEDRRFALHPGVDSMAVLRAFGQLVVRRHIVSGASTLTMQTVRLLHHHPRTLAAKLIEMTEALALERNASKDEILGIYMTLAPFGGNLEGVRAASLAYFGREPSRLTPAEAALLVAIPRSPERLRPDRHPAAARQARNRVLSRMLAAGVISPAAYADARAEPVPNQRSAMPFHAPHLGSDLRKAEPGQAVIRTTIDPLLQRQVEALLSREVGVLDSHATYAALVVDNRQRQTVAYVGNAIFASTGRRGTIDMARAVRSPGSALKPFIYAMAFDRLIVHPETLLDDRRRDFGDYAPSDFDGRFQGEVSAREALQYSLNVPAVAVLQRLGPERFVSALAAAGIRLHLPQSTTEPGLAVALGGDGITLTDLATLYVALSHGGKVAPLRYRANEPPGPETSLFGPVAAWYVDDTLGAAPPPPGILPAPLRHRRPLAFKTGTSYGFRDSWAAGYDREFTIVVWAGRPDGTSLPGSSGLRTAAPMVFKIADLLGPAPAGSSGQPPPPGALLVSRPSLPPRLQRLRPGPLDGAASGEADAPRILFPPNGATIEWDGWDLPLEAAGGSGSLHWLVDGRPLPPAAPRRPLYWLPSGIGFAQITVIDSAGHSAHANVRLVPWSNGRSSGLSH